MSEIPKKINDKLPKVLDELPTHPESIDGVIKQPFAFYSKVPNVINDEIP